MKILNLSGGATKISGLGGASICLLRDKGYEPQVITGVSAGAILTLPLAIGKYDELEKIVRNFTLDDIFSIKPITKRGKISLRAIYRTISGKVSMGEERNIIKTLKKLVSENDYERYQHSDLPSAIIMSVDLKTGKRIVVDLKSKDISYDECMEYVLASASIPLMTPPVSVGGNEYLMDGGIRNGMIFGWTVREFGNKISQTINVFSRPKNIEDSLSKDWKPKNQIDILERTIEIMILENSKSDEADIILLSEKYNIDSKILYMPIILKSLFDTDKSRIILLYDTAYTEALKINI